LQQFLSHFSNSAGTMHVNKFLGARWKTLKSRNDWG
jgi:hypothetical protein